jgi:ubiquilin
MYRLGRRPLQDDDKLSVYKIQSNHTIHMVKGAARSTNASSSAQAPTPQPLPNMQTGQNVHDPLTQLNSHLGYGLMAGLNPFADMGINPNDPNMVRLCPLFLNVTKFDKCTAADDDELP